MMHENPARKGRLFLVIVVCGVLLAVSLVFWIVNIVMGVQALNDNFLSEITQLSLMKWFTPYAADLSTVTTLVPVLVFLYPIIHAFRIIDTENSDPEKLKNLDPDPYPAQFALFMVLLGLAGTLYGMFLGLDTSGISTISEGGEGTDVNLAIQRLLAGIATAILSSLAGLVGAFVAASPITRIFQWAACFSEEEEEEDLFDILKNLARNLSTVSTGGVAAAGIAAASSGSSGEYKKGSSDGGGDQDEMTSQMEGVLEELHQHNQEAKRSREALKKALAVYAKHL